MTTLVNPGNPTFSPWLSGVSINYDRYCFHKLAIYYVPTTSTLVTGNIVISYEPNPTSSVNYT